MDQKARPAVSVIIPTLNEERALGETLEAVRRVLGVAEVLVSDGGSSDATLTIARQRNCRIVYGECGRGARGDILWFVHADTRPLPSAGDEMLRVLVDPQVVGGYFRVQFDGTHGSARFFAWTYGWAQRFGLCYGDSAFFVRREAYAESGGFRPLPLFKDLDLRGRLVRVGRFVRVPATVTTSARRFEGRSATLMLARWLTLQVLYWLGVPPARLARFYAAIRSPRSRTYASEA